jgi:hypothetical protein
VFLSEQLYFGLMASLAPNRHPNRHPGGGGGVVVLHIPCRWWHPVAATDRDRGGIHTTLTGELVASFSYLEEFLLWGVLLVTHK